MPLLVEVISTGTVALRIEFCEVKDGLTRVMELFKRINQASILRLNNDNVYTTTQADPVAQPIDIDDPDEDEDEADTPVYCPRCSCENLLMQGHRPDCPYYKED